MPWKGPFQLIDVKYHSVVVEMHPTFEGDGGKGGELVIPVHLCMDDLPPKRCISDGQQQGTVEAPEGGNCPIAYMLFSKPIMLGNCRTFCHVCIHDRMFANLSPPCPTDHVKMNAATI
ncbi:hypothetical protein GR268_43415 [Rhizobium leguminosarum]|nr:hypothetical protein [Rhizobium leguminosarum]